MIDPHALRTLIEHWIHDSRLQTFEDRERFRAEARALLSALPETKVEHEHIHEYEYWNRIVVGDVCAAKRNLPPLPSPQRRRSRE